MARDMILGDVPQYDLTIVIPARNEMFVARTVADILENRRGKTEVIVGLDGEWAEPGIEDHQDVTIVYVSESLGQRALTNRLVKLSKSKYVAKCDAHCSFKPGFDVELMKAMEGHDNWTVVPTMKNLHAFDWVCPDGHRRYQGPSGQCETCGKPTERDVIWYAKPSPNSTAYTFDTTMHFQYFGEFRKRDEGKGDITPSMSLQGSFFMLTRDKYWELNICDEGHGSWGQQGVEVACKTWLSGGAVMVVQTTWYAHMFRTQGGDFSFPYPQKQKDVLKAREYSRNLWQGNNWPLAKHKLQWLIDRFNPGNGWSTSSEVGIIYYTDNQLKLSIAKAVQGRIKKIAAERGFGLTSSSLKPMENMGNNVHLKLERGSLTMFKQILAALKASSAETIFFCEADVLYHPSHFDFEPKEKDKFYYNLNVWRVRKDGKAVTWDANQVAELCCNREYAIKWYENKINEIETVGFNRSYEPGGRDATQYENWRSEYPNIDIRHESNFTKSKWSIDDFRDKSTCVNWKESTIDNIDGWDSQEINSVF